jgi:hypothetical protein
MATQRRNEKARPAQRGLGLRQDGLPQGKNTDGSFPVPRVEKERAALSCYRRSGKTKNNEEREGTADTTADAPGRNDRRRRGKSVRRTSNSQSHNHSQGRERGLKSVRRGHLSRRNGPPARNYARAMLVARYLQAYEDKQETERGEEREKWDYLTLDATRKYANMAVATFDASHFVVGAFVRSREKARPSAT